MGHWKRQIEHYQWVEHKKDISQREEKSTNSRNQDLDQNMWSVTTKNSLHSKSTPPSGTTQLLLTGIGPAVPPPETTAGWCWSR
jgi:hypothetical protein